MANRFFPAKEPRAGMPFSFEGLARGIRKMANALARLEVVGGHVEWNAFDEPKIIIDPAATMEPSTEGGGSERWGPVEYDEAYHQLVQYKETWNTETGEYEKNETPELIVELESHSSQHES